MKSFVISGLFLLLSIQVYAQTDYQKELSQIKKDRRSLKQNNISDDSIKNYLLNKFENNIFPFWVGTPWDYNGYTNTPKKSTIACGYFVSTTLQHLGFSWNRYKLAKMYSQHIVESICDSIYTFDTKEQLHTYVRYRPDNLYILGLSGHVGMILKYKGNVWFVHSDYHNVIGPVKEKIEESEALNDSQVFWCGTFLNHKNIDKWLNQKKYGNDW